MKKYWLFISLFFVSLFASTSVVFAGDCIADLNLEKGTLNIPCVQVMDDENDKLYSVVMEVEASKLGNSMNWRVAVVNTSTIEAKIAVVLPCKAEVDLNDGNKGILILPCVESETEDMYSVIMKQRGRAMVWAVSFALLEITLPESECVAAKMKANKCKTKVKIYDEEEIELEIEPAASEKDENKEKSRGKSDSAKNRPPGKNK